MIRPEYFSPGYTHQGFSYFRAGLWTAAEEVSRKKQLVRFIAWPSVYLISKASEYAEVYPRTIEDVALTAINLVGATFNQRCRRNLSESAVWLATDMLMIWWQTMIFTVPLFRQIALYWNGYQAIKSSVEPKPQSHRHLGDFFLTRANRNPHVNREHIVTLTKDKVHIDLLKYIAAAKSEEQANTIFQHYQAQKSAGVES